MLEEPDAPPAETPAALLDDVDEPPVEPPHPLRAQDVPALITKEIG